jgi:hypothetical protein
MAILQLAAFARPWPSSDEFYLIHVVCEYARTRRLLGIYPVIALPTVSVPPLF